MVTPREQLEMVVKYGDKTKKNEFSDALSKNGGKK